MKLYDSIGPNPRIVRMFMAEKGIEIPKQTVDLRGGENRQAEHLKRNPHGQMPALELDDGNYLSEITAICEYLEEKNPKPPMIGATPEQRAECRMWTRRVDLNIAEPLANGYRFGEALKSIPNHTLTKVDSNIAWAGPKGFRDIASHWYEEGLDHRLIWHALANDLPPMLDSLQRWIDTSSSSD